MDSAPPFYHPAKASQASIESPLKIKQSFLRGQTIITKFKGAFCFLPLFCVKSKKKAYACFKNQINDFAQSAQKMSKLTTLISIKVNMTSFLLKNSDHTSLVALYRKIDLTKEKLLSLYASPLRMQPLLHLEATLPGGGSISLLPCGGEELLLCVRTKSYAGAHACACALVELFRQAEKKDCQN